MRSGFHRQLRLQWCTAGEWPGTVVVAGGGEQSMGHRVAGRIGIGIGTGLAATTLGVAWRGVASDGRVRATTLGFCMGLVV